MNELTDEEIEAVLEHHGVKGMKWGVRRAAQVGKQSRINANDRYIAKNHKVANRRILPAKKTAARNIANLEKSNERLKNGKVQVRDILDVHSKITLRDLHKAIQDTPVN